MSILLPVLQHHYYFVLNLFSTISMPCTRTTQLREAAAHACSVCAQSQSTTPATTPAASI